MKYVLSKNEKYFFSILIFTCLFSHSQFDETEGVQRWIVLGSMNDDSVFLKLEASNLFKLSFKKLSIFK